MKIGFKGRDQGNFGDGRCELPHGRQVRRVVGRSDRTDFFHRLQDMVIDSKDTL